MNIHLLSSHARLQALLVFALVMCALPSVAIAGSEFAVVVNKDNAYSEDQDAAVMIVRQLFLRERGAWPDGTEAKPFSPEWGAPTHEAMLETLLSMNPADLSRHWVSLKSKTGETAPRELKSDKTILKIVGRYKGGFGVVSADAAEASGDVRVLFKFP